MYMNWYKIAKKSVCKGWLAVRLNKEDSSKVQKWGKKQIADESLYHKEKEQGKQTDMGREIDTHITVIYGLCSNSEEVVKAILKEQKPIKAKLGKVGFFKHPDGYEPLIIKVESPNLERIHRMIKSDLRVETTFDDYKPHCTIAYLKEGEAMKFAGDTTFDGIECTFDKIVFVNSEDEEIVISLKK